MIDVVRWVVAIGEVAAIGGIVYWFAIRIQQLLNYAEQLLEAARVLLALAPGKSAPRTEAPEPEVVGKAWGLIDMVPAERRPSPVKRVPTDTDEMDRVDVEQARDSAKHGRHSVKRA